MDGLKSVPIRNSFCRAMDGLKSIPIRNSFGRAMDGLKSVPNPELLCGLGLLFGLFVSGFFFLEGLAVDEDLVDLDLDESLAVSLHLLVLLLALELEDEDFVVAAFAEHGP